MSEALRCLNCGEEIPPDSPEGLCRRCLLKVGLRQPTCLHVRCPHCRNPIELVNEVAVTDVECPSCGSHFSMVTADTAFFPDSAKSIGHFDLLEQVGVGHFGSVWKARDTELDRLVAVKIPRKGQLDSTETEHFVREARAAAHVRHANIVSVHEVGRDGEIVYIVSDFIDGANLSEWLTRGRLTPTEAVELCAKIADALHEAHEAGIVHRDLKPGNIMLDSHGEPYLTDFGLAKRETSEITITFDGRILGTPAYMSPEQASGRAHEADRRSDIYSLGVVLFQLLTDELPFRGETRMLVVQILQDEPPSPRKFDGDISRDLETICLKCLQKNANARYETAGDFSADLRRWLNNEPIQARPVSSAARLWRWSVRHPAITTSVAAVALAVITVIASLTVMLIQQQRMQAQRIENDRKRVASLVDALMGTSAEGVPFGLQTLEPFHDLAAPILQERFTGNSLEPAHRLHLAYALAACGRVEHEVLVAGIATVDPSELANIVGALDRNRDLALKALKEAGDSASSDANLRYKARLAIAALHLQDSTLAQDMCQNRPDPIQRTVFIDEFPTWHIPTSLGRLAEEIDNPGLRYGICLGIGGIAVDQVPVQAKRAWQPVLSNWHQNEADKGTHNASGWILRRWALDLPTIPPSKQPAAGMDWHVNSIDMTMLKIAAGSFIRKDTSDENADAQKVTLDRSFLMSDCEVSKGHFLNFLNDPDYPNSKKPDWTGFEGYHLRSDDHPVQCINWDDAQLFCNWLSHREGLPLCYQRFDAKGMDGAAQFGDWTCNNEVDGYRLPTEAEWEYACRAGTVTEYTMGNDHSVLVRYAVYFTNNPEICGSRFPNGWGLFDLHGNMYELCQDWFGPYGVERYVRNPVGPTRGTRRVLRGGAFNLPAARNVRSAYRLGLDAPGSRGMNTGFRVVRTCP